MLYISVMRNLVSSLASGVCGVLSLLVSFAGGLTAQALPQPEAIHAWARRHAEATLDEFRECLALANDSYYPDQVEANVRWAEHAFSKRNFTTKRLDTGGPPLLLAEFTGSKTSEQTTVLVYLQMDGQPVDSSFWRQPSPYEAVLKEEVAGEGWLVRDWSALRQNWSQEAKSLNMRIFARSTSDAKGPVMMFLAAMDALAVAGKTPPYGLKVIIDFEEEVGSPHLPAAVGTYREDLAADRLVIFDGPIHPSNEPTVSFGARGIATVTLETFGPRQPQHSGHYGNYVPNPAWDMIRLLEPLVDENGRVTLEGWYGGIDIDEETRAILEGVPDDPADLRARQSLGRFSGVGRNLQEALQYPSLNIRGLSSGWVREEVRTLIPSTALVEIDIRTVVESDPDYLLALLKEYIVGKGFYVVEGREPTLVERTTHPYVIRWDSKVAYQAFRTELDSPTGKWLTEALRYAYGKPPLRIRTMGGSIPISPFVTTLGVPAVGVPTVQSDNNQHAPNENLRLGNYVDGIASMIAILLSPTE